LLNPKPHFALKTSSVLDNKRHSLRALFPHHRGETKRKSGVEVVKNVIFNGIFRQQQRILFFFVSKEQQSVSCCSICVYASYEFFNSTTTRKRQSAAADDGRQSVFFGRTSRRTIFLF